MDFKGDHRIEVTFSSFRKLRGKNDVERRTLMEQLRFRPDTGNPLDCGAHLKLGVALKKITLPFQTGNVVLASEYHPYITTYVIYGISEKK